VNIEQPVAVEGTGCGYPIGRSGACRLGVFPARAFGFIAVATGLFSIQLFAALPPGAGVTYIRDQIKEVPWTVHVARVDRQRSDVGITTTLGKGTSFGMSLVSDQVKLFPAEFGKPLAAINGDFYSTDRLYPGDPEGLQILRGQLVSAPVAQRSCIWIDADGNPHMTNAAAAFAVTWPNGTQTRFGLNEERTSGTAVLYTSANGPSTRCSSGTELILERAASDQPWLPLQVGKTYSARVRQVNTRANSPITRDTAVLSISSSIYSKAPKVSAGEIIKLSTTTIPDMAGAQTGVGGGPALVRGGKVLPHKSTGRHPRSAFGWSSRYFFMVEVDGRQSMSAGMTYSELAEYMVRLGCTDALNLDGGGSATLWVYGSVINRPSEGRERPSANALVVFQRKESETTAAKQ
jgi:hypothetical protein